MPRKKNPPPVPKPTAGMKREAGELRCNVCKFTVPYQGFTDPDIDPRPQHRCIDSIRPFDVFDTNPPKMIRRVW